MTTLSFEVAVVGTVSTSMDILLMMRRKIRYDREGLSHAVGREHRLPQIALFMEYTGAVYIETCGSKMEWLRTLVKRDVIKKKALATRTQNEKRSAFLRALDPWFDSYVRSIRFKETGEEELKQCSRRFVALKAKLKERGLCLQPDSAPCNVFITTGRGKCRRCGRNRSRLNYVTPLSRRTTSLQGYSFSLVCRRYLDNPYE
ncbi:hypothetical protein GQ600_429 [Phytophthora cactorum]|nr:hypothetical protein GQ600_429 [Phytophthora cactorum]